MSLQKLSGSSIDFLYSSSYCSLVEIAAPAGATCKRERGVARLNGGRRREDDVWVVVKLDLLGTENKKLRLDLDAKGTSCTLLPRIASAKEGSRRTNSWIIMTVQRQKTPIYNVDGTYLIQ